VEWLDKQMSEFFAANPPDGVGALGEKLQDTL
jgi:hypothetical protein